jgi:hypothetical protein
MTFVNDQSGFNLAGFVKTAYDQYYSSSTSKL